MESRGLGLYEDSKAIFLPNIYPRYARLDGLVCKKSGLGSYSNIPITLTGAVTMDLATHLNNIAASTRAWVAEDPANRWAVHPVTDVAYWAEQGITTVDQFVRDGLLSEFSDAYKSARGFRPRYDVSHLTNDQLQKMISDLYAEAMANYEAEKEWDRMDAEWREQEDKRDAEAKAEADWVMKWQHHYNRLVGV